MAKKILLGILIAILFLAFPGPFIFFGVKFAIIYAIYRAIKGLMTHNANLKSQRDNDRWNAEGRF